jgi:hypothetical protein
MTGKAFLRLVGPPDAEQLSDPHRHRAGKHLVSSRVLVLSRPDAVLILRDTGDLLRLDASVTSTTRATAGTVVLAGWGILSRHGWRQCETHYYLPRRVRCLAHGYVDVAKDSAPDRWRRLGCFYLFRTSESMTVWYVNQHCRTGPLVSLGIPRSAFPDANPWR